MNKEQFIEWAKAESVDGVFIASSDFSAKGIWDGLELWHYSEETQKRMAREYRQWRFYYKNTKLCFDYVKSGIELPIKESNE